MFKRLLGRIAERIMPAKEMASVAEDNVLHEVAFATDDPISSKLEDRFGRASFAHRIADTLARRRDPGSLVVALYGPWGDGKTSTLLMLEESLRQKEDVLVVRYNPWHFRSHDQLLKSFFATLASGIGAKISSRSEDFGELLSNYGALLSVASITVGGLVQISPGQAAQDIGKSLSNVEIDELHNRIDNLLLASGKRVIVLIDDIDRLDREETHALFKLVKLSAGFKYTSYVLAFDAEVVAAALGERYGDGKQAAGMAFLEKIIQVPLYLPPADRTALRALTLNGVDAALDQAKIKLAQTDIDSFVVNFDTGIEPHVTTPRQARLYGNALLFALPLMKGEVDTVDLLLIEGIRIFHPKLYLEIRGNPALFLDQNGGTHDDIRARQEEFDHLLDTSTPYLNARERQMLKRGILRYLFPRSAQQGYGSDWDSIWGRNRRISSRDYFRRYFSYGIPPNDVSDNELSSLINISDKIDADKLSADIHRISLVAPAHFIRKLRNWRETIRDTQASAMALAIARAAGNFPSGRGMLQMGGTRLQAEILISQLIRQIANEEERVLVAEHVLNQSPSLIFCVEQLRWFEPGRDDHEDDWFLTAEARNKLRRLVSQRISIADANEAIFRQFGSEAPSLYWLWNHTNEDEVRQRLTALFDADPAAVDAFLDTFVGEAWEMDSGLPRRSDFDRRNYDSVCELIDPLYIENNLVARYGDELLEPHYHHAPNTPLRIQFAHQFIIVHKAVIEERARTQSGST